MATRRLGCLVGELEYPHKRAITFDPTVASRLNVFRGFQRLFPWVSDGTAIQ
jgi:hypothetical protein